MTARGLLGRVALALCLAPAAAGAAPAGDTYAVIVGYNGAAPGLPPLRFADDDAVRFSLMLSGLAGADAPGHVALLARLDADTERDLSRAGLRAAPVAPPTRAAVLAAIAQVGRALAARPAGAPAPTFYFIYAGHGLRGRILLEPEAGGEAALTGHELRAAVAELARAAPELRAYLFLDACRSQSLFTERGAGDAGPDLSAEIAALEDRAGAARIGVLTAAFSGRPAGEVRALGAGYFSHALASGLAGAADADGDERVSFAELAAFVAYNTERLGAQRPWFSPPAGDLAAPVVDLRGARTRLELTGAPTGRYLVEAAGGRPIFAEAVKGERRPLRLALPPGRYRVLRATDRETTRAADVELVAGAPVDLARAPWTELAATAPTLARGESDAPDALDPAAPVFSSAFGPEAVSTLTAAYDAGREPPSATRSFAHEVGVAATLAGAPVGLDGVEPGVAIRYRQTFGQLYAGASAAFGRSSHVAGTSYRLDRFTVLLEAGPRWPLFAERLTLSLALAAGGGPVLRRGDAGVSGDSFAPLLGVGAGAALRVDGRWSATLDARGTLQWVSVDGTSRQDAGLVALAGLACGF
jgi:hypothetical protein